MYNNRGVVHCLFKRMTSLLAQLQAWRAPLAARMALHRFIPLDLVDLVDLAGQEKKRTSFELSSTAIRAGHPTDDVTAVEL